MKKYLTQRLNRLIIGLFFLQVAGFKPIVASTAQPSEKPFTAQVLDHNGNTALMLAIRAKDHHRAQQLLAADADPNLKRSGKDQYFGWTALMFALENQDLQSLQLLLKYKASPNALMKTHYGSGWTPLMYAIETKQTEAALALIDAGANLEMRNDYTMQSIQDGGITALSLALRRHDKAVAKALITRGADFLTLYDGPNGQSSALSEAMYSQQKDLVSLMLKQRLGTKGAPTACHIAAQYGLYAELKTIPNALNQKNCNTPLNDGSTAFLWAAYQGEAQMLKALKNLGIKLQHKDKQGHNALGYLQKGLSDRVSAYAPERLHGRAPKAHFKNYQLLIQWGIKETEPLDPAFKLWLKQCKNSGQCDLPKD